jgi:hypothetical protein
MKKKEIRALLKIIRREQYLTLQALDIIKAGYSQEQHDTAEDSAPSATIKKPDIRQPVIVIEPVTQLQEQYR